MNPILPFEYCIPDGEPRVFGNRVYLYGSSDSMGEMEYCSYYYYVFSASIHDLSNWTNHGLSFASRGPYDQVAWSDGRLYAPDVIEKDGVYYLYFCLSDGTEGVATSDCPYGPFTDAKQMFYPREINDGAQLSHIDPAAFVDEDGSVYYYWGQFNAQCARLKSNMYELEAKTYQSNMITEEEHNFHEGSSMRKIGDTYYLVYCSTVTGRANTLDYATSSSPLGPFEYQGVIINNFDADPDSWNIHGSIVKVKDQWYVFYHRSSNYSRFSRRACIEPIYIDDDGKIQEIQMTTNGTEPPLNPYRMISAARACKLIGGNYISSSQDGSVLLVNNHNSDYAEYKFFDFGKDLRKEPMMFSICVLAKTDKGYIDIILDDPDSQPIGHISLNDCCKDSWISLKTEVHVKEGIHSVILKFRSIDINSDLCHVAWFRFED